MNKIYTSLAILLFPLAGALAQASSIVSYTVVPATPTSNDTIRIVVECYFTNSACTGTVYLNGISPNQVDAGAIHCLGNIASPCTAFDTVVIPPQPAGDYSMGF